MLFNVKDDPYEQRDISGAHPEICAQGAKLILDWHDEQMAKSKSQIDPLWTVLAEGGPHHTIGYLESYLEYLEKTGRHDGARALREKYMKNSH